MPLAPALLGPAAAANPAGGSCYDNHDDHDHDDHDYDDYDDHDYNVNTVAGGAAKGEGEGEKEAREQNRIHAGPVGPLRPLRGISRQRIVYMSSRMSYRMLAQE